MRPTLVIVTVMLMLSAVASTPVPGDLEPTTLYCPKHGHKYPYGPDDLAPCYQVAAESKQPDWKLPLGLLGAAGGFFLLSGVSWCVKKDTPCSRFLAKAKDSRRRLVAKWKDSRSRSRPVLPAQLPVPAVEQPAPAEQALVQLAEQVPGPHLNPGALVAAVHRRSLPADDASLDVRRASGDDVEQMTRRQIVSVKNA